MTPRSPSLEYLRQDVLRDVTERGQADVDFLRILARYASAVHNAAIDECIEAAQRVKLRGHPNVL